ncbi:MAG: asparagine synthase (glutamine-hydrolyzing) [Planctomycetales bacterium]|nr:asparagine synthase (glutamine-hydrolyzing) [Planctomycetales bacterium]NIM09863.1 asparagine synthase (glutamine-hydrolyzing) [Planctomycetales bacterium]NIN09303.1 asparagine synthase (glutamine-hydrolyzing) [Planctomycetales bacterium]NIN78410.1 asparagine synthase (glutamine-hydrolyzing) [Planctomycetales bacterium]NIO35588.1 asparagine synthase (glutamine-hydrolyzing) [Planctomycetales bacterium]
MCGIFGIIHHAARDTPCAEKLQASTDALAHRGPDNFGLHRDAGVGLVHTRLSLVDLNPRSNQPFWDAERRYCLVYNGEIYNFRLLREELEAAGISFRTTSDTEVLLEMLIHHGAAATLPRLEGMFAFAFFDSQTRHLLLGRDRFGFKPLMIYEDRDKFLFASEPLALKPWVDLKPNPLSVAFCLQGNGFPTKGFSLFEGVKIVAPGDYVQLRPGQPSCTTRYARVIDLWDKDETARLAAKTDSELVDLFDQKFHESIQSQMFADAQVGAFCSGGVDSSLVMAVACKYHKDLAIFHANVVGGESETWAAEELARSLGLELKSVEVHDDDFADSMVEVIRHFGAPYAYHPNSVPFLAVSKLVRAHGVKGILSGEGSDECYLGYHWVVPRLRDWLCQLPAGLKTRLRRALKGPNVFRRRRPRSNPLLKHVESHFEKFADEEELRRLPWGLTECQLDPRNLKSIEYLNFHLRTLLHRNDALGMAASIEARFPFLDTSLVRFAVNLPYRAKIRLHPLARHTKHGCFIDKWIVRQAAARYLPPLLTRREKMGFPSSNYRRLEIDANLFRDGFSAELFGLANQDVDLLLEYADRNLRLRLVQLDIWGDIFLRGKPPSAVRERLLEHVSFRRVKT